MDCIAVARGATSSVSCPASLSVLEPGTTKTAFSILFIFLYSTLKMRFEAPF